MLRQAVRVEHTKLFKRSILWIELALLALVVAVLYVVLYSILLGGSSGDMPPEAIKETLTWPAGLTGSLSFAAGHNLGGILMIVLVGAFVAQEYTWNTVQLWLSRGIPRPLFLSAKFTALLSSAVLIVLTPLIAGGLISAVFSLHFLGGIPADQVAWGRLGLRILLFTYSLLPYAALTFFLAVAGRSTVLSIGGGLAYALLIEGIAVQLIGAFGGIWGEIGRYLPAGLARGLLATNAGITVEINGSTGKAIQYLDPGPAALGIALYVLLFVAASLLIFQRQDLSD